MTTNEGNRTQGNKLGEKNRGFRKTPSRANHFSLQPPQPVLRFSPRRHPQRQPYRT